MMIVDTPGFGASDDVAAHIAAQKLALEGTALSGVYIVAKYARAEEIAEFVSTIMSFLGDDDVRIIVTWADTARGEIGYDPQGTREVLSQLLGINIANIVVVEKQTEEAYISNFIKSTVHSPRPFNVSDEQVARISSLCISTRKFNKAIEEVYAKIAAASKACADATAQSRNFSTDTAIVTIQHATSEMVKDSKERIFRDAYSTNLSDDDRNVIYGKAGFALSLRLKTFIESSNTRLSWNVNDLSNSRNVYKKCNYCFAVFNKTQGCNGETTCGNVPSYITIRRPMLDAQFHSSSMSGWIVQYFWGGVAMDIKQVLGHIDYFSDQNTIERKNYYITSRKPGSIIEYGCGKKIAWNTMLPVDAHIVQSLGSVEIQSAGCAEERTGRTFHEHLQQHTESNRKILQDGLRRQN